MKELDSMEINATVTGKKEENGGNGGNNEEDHTDLVKTLVTVVIGYGAVKLLSNRNR